MDDRFGDFLTLRTVTLDGNSGSIGTYSGISPARSTPPSSHEVDPAMHSNKIVFPEPEGPYMQWHSLARNSALR
jgi:hypothetical protein